MFRIPGSQQQQLNYYPLQSQAQSDFIRESTQVEKTVLPLIFVEANSMIRMGVPFKNSSLQVSWIDNNGQRQLGSWCIQCRQEIVLPVTEHFIRTPCFFNHDNDGRSFSKVSIHFQDVTRNAAYELPIQPVPGSYAENRVREQVLPPPKLVPSIQISPITAKVVSPTKMSQPREITNTESPNPGKRVREEVPLPKRLKIAPHEEGKEIEPAITSSVGNVINLNIPLKKSSLQVTWVDRKGILHGPTNWCTKCNQNIVVPSAIKESQIKFQCEPSHKTGNPDRKMRIPFLYFEDQSDNVYEIPVKLHARRHKRSNMLVPENRHLTPEDVMKYLMKDEDAISPNQPSITPSVPSEPVSIQKATVWRKAASTKAPAADTIAFSEKPLAPVIVSAVNLAINLNLKIKELSFAYEWTDNNGERQNPTNWCSLCNHQIVVLSKRDGLTDTHIKLLCNPSHRGGNSKKNIPTDTLYFQDVSGTKYQVPVKIMARRPVRGQTGNLRELSPEDARKYAIPQ